MIQNDSLLLTTMNVEYQIETSQKEIYQVEVDSPYIASYKNQFFNLIKHELNNLEKLDRAFNFALSKLR